MTDQPASTLIAAFRDAPSIAGDAGWEAAAEASGAASLSFATASGPSAYVAIVTATFDAPEDHADACLGALLEALGTTGAHAYLVRPIIQLEDPARAPGEQPGVAAFYFVRRNPALDAAEARRLWREHAPTARTHHTGMSRYVQNGVLRPLTPGAPPVDGIAILHFPKREDFEERFYSDEAGRNAIQAEASRLVESSTTVLTTEYVVRL